MWRIEEQCVLSIARVICNERRGPCSLFLFAYQAAPINKVWLWGMVIGDIEFGTVFRQILKPDRQISLITTLHTTSTGSEREQWCLAITTIQLLLSLKSSVTAHVTDNWWRITCRLHRLLLLSPHGCRKNIVCSCFFVSMESNIFNGTYLNKCRFAFDKVFCKIFLSDAKLRMNQIHCDSNHRNYYLTTGDLWEP